VALPDYNRLLLTSNRDFCRVSGHGDNPPLVQKVHSILSDTSVGNRPKYSKKPYEFTDFITPEYALFQTFRSINSLISYCKGSNIKLVWSNWDYETNEIINVVKKKFNTTSYSGYVYADFSFNGDRDRNQKTIENYSGCHSEYVGKYGENFFCGQDKAQDQSDSNYSSHPGVHYHIHLAEAMLGKFEELNN
jgi:hypothetical protein